MKRQRKLDWEYKEERFGLTRTPHDILAQQPEFECLANREVPVLELWGRIEWYSGSFISYCCNVIAEAYNLTNDAKIDGEYTYNELREEDRLCLAFRYVRTARAEIRKFDVYNFQYGAGI